jgi:hypothetical protein
LAEKQKNRGLGKKLRRRHGEGRVDTESGGRNQVERESCSGTRAGRRPRSVSPEVNLQDLTADGH